MPLIRIEGDKARSADDGYAIVTDDAPLPDGAILVSLARFEKDRDTLLARNTPIGVTLKSDENPERLGDAVNRLSLVVLDFPKFRDGRAFSWARILRTRLNFTGEIRATGDFLYDQVAHLHRVGFDAFQHDGLTPALVERALSEITDAYQPSADGKKTIRELRSY